MAFRLVRVAESRRVLLGHVSIAKPQAILAKLGNRSFPEIKCEDLCKSLDAERPESDGDTLLQTGKYD